MPGQHRVTVIRTLPRRPSDLIARYSGIIAEEAPLLPRRRIAAKRPARSRGPSARSADHSKGGLSRQQGRRAISSRTNQRRDRLLGRPSGWPTFTAAGLSGATDREASRTPPHARSASSYYPNYFAGPLHMVTPRATPLPGHHRDHGSFDNGEPPYRPAVRNSAIVLSRQLEVTNSMIKRFHALYVGQIELDNIGLQGTPANDRRYPNERLSEVFWTARDVAREMDELGYYAFWTAEHHFQREGYECLPNLIQLGLWLATQTRHLKFGCAFNILPMWHPIRLAEDYAMADIVTDGRVIMGVGRGYHTREVETFGAPLLDAEANRELFEEQLQLLLKCFNEEAFHHKGKYYECPPSVPYRGYQLEEITVVPRPKHLPVEIWMPIASGRTIDMMAKYGLKAMVTLNGEKILDDVVRAFHAACVRARPRLRSSAKT